MKLFQNLRKSFQHYGQCPLCGGHTRPDINAQFENYSIGNKEYHETIVVTVSGGGDSFYIDTVDNSFSLETMTVDHNRTHYLSSLSTPWYKQHVAHVVEKVSISCTKCKNYKVGIGLVADLRRKRIDEIHTNFEKINVPVDDEMYEITNSYSTKQTKLIKHSSNGKAKKETFPIMAEDMKDPAAMIKRIQTLIPFL